MTAPLALAILAVVLAWPVPIVLARATWTARSPAAALLLWQAIAIAGGLSMIGALLTFGLVPFGDDLVSGGVGFIAWMVGTAPLRPVELWNALALGGALLLTVHLLLNLLLTVVRAERQRRRHEQLLLLLSAPIPAGGGARLLDSPAPVAYCLPGALSSVTVVSAGLIALLDEPGMRAVIEHEKAHVRERHDIVLVLFRAWHTSLPWFPIAYRAQREVGLLIELLADDRARRHVDDAVLARAIAQVGAGRSEPRDATEWRDAASIDTVSIRIARLDPAVMPLPRALEGAIVAAAIGLVAVPTLLLLLPAVLSALA